MRVRGIADIYLQNIKNKDSTKLSPQATPILLSHKLQKVLGTDMLYSHVTRSGVGDRSAVSSVMTMLLLGLTKFMHDRV